MKLPLQITYRNMKPSPLVEEWIRDEATKLDTFYNRIMACRVAIEVPHRHHKKGKPLHVRIDLTLPGKEIVIKREPVPSRGARTAGKSDEPAKLHALAPHHDLHLVLHDAFKAAGRRIQDFARCHRGNVKTHAEPAEAVVSKILPERGYGFLESSDGRAIYFHEQSVLGNGFKRLKVGKAVIFSEELGEEGPQASTVRPVRSKRLQEREEVSAPKA